MRAGKSSLRDRLHSLLGKPGVGPVAARLLREGSALWSADPHRVQEAIDKVEQAWALTRDPKIAIQLATMYDKANRNDDALVVLREAFRKDPQHALLRHHAAITLLRHGEPADIRDFFEGVLKVDAQDAFARFVMTLLDRYDGWVAQLASSIERKRDGRRPFLISLPVWGEDVCRFLRPLFLRLAAVSQQPAGAGARPRGPYRGLHDRRKPRRCFGRSRCSVASRTTPPSISCTIRRDLIDYGRRWSAATATRTVHYSQNSLAFYYARNCKFALMSCAHYVALAAGRASDALVSCMVADIVMNDGALPGMAETHEATPMPCWSMPCRCTARIVRPIIDREFRDADGVLAIPSDACSTALVRYMPADNFADTRRFADPPLRIAWRVGEDGLLVHGNHYHPYCLRPKASTHPLRLSIDPVDSRFIDRTSLDMRSDPPRAGCQHRRAWPSTTIRSSNHRTMAWASCRCRRFALWLWGYWGRLRGGLFRSPLRYRFGGAAREEWQRVEAGCGARSLTPSSAKQNSSKNPIG